VTDAITMRTFQAAVANLNQALDEVPGHARARHVWRASTRSSWGRARERRDQLNRV